MTANGADEYRMTIEDIRDRLDEVCSIDTIDEIDQKLARLDAQQDRLTDAVVELCSTVKDLTKLSNEHTAKINEFVDTLNRLLGPKEPTPPPPPAPTPFTRPPRKTKRSPPTGPEAA